MQALTTFSPKWTSNPVSNPLKFQNDWSRHLGDELHTDGQTDRQTDEYYMNYGKLQSCNIMVAYLPLVPIIFELDQRTLLYL